MSTGRLACVMLLSALLSACASEGQVTRRRGEWQQEGRKISALAYAWYARGAHDEAEGDDPSAERAYRAALDHDPKSGVAWAALGRVLCRTQDSGAERVFAKGLRTAERRAPIYAERGECGAKRAQGDKHRLAAACGDFAQAMRLEPYARGIATRHVSCLRQAGMQSEAERHERAARIFFGAPPSPNPQTTLLAVDRALVDGDLTRAQDLSLELMSPGALAARAVLLGQSAIAREQALFVLGASPGDVDASAALLALGTAPPPSTANLSGLSPPGLVLLLQMLRRRVNEEAAQHFLEEFRSDLATSEDALIVESLREFHHAR